MQRPTRGILIGFTMFALLSLPGDAASEHCGGAIYVDGLQPAAPELWKIGESRSISWSVGTDWEHILPL